MEALNSLFACVLLHTERSCFSLCYPGRDCSDSHMDLEASTYNIQQYQSVLVSW